MTLDYLPVDVDNAVELLGANFSVTA